MATTALYPATEQWTAPCAYQWLCHLRLAQCNLLNLLPSPTPCSLLQRRILRRPPRRRCLLADLPPNSDRLLFPLSLTSVSVAGGFLFRSCDEVQKHVACRAQPKLRRQRCHLRHDSYEVSCRMVMGPIQWCRQASAGTHISPDMQRLIEFLSFCRQLSIMNKPDEPLALKGRAGFLTPPDVRAKPDPDPGLKCLMKTVLFRRIHFNTPRPHQSIGKRPPSPGSWRPKKQG